MLLLELDLQGKTSHLDSLYFDCSLRDAIHIRLEIAKNNVDILFYLTKNTFGVALINDNSFGLVREFSILESLGDYWKPSSIALDYKDRAIALISLEQNIVVFRLKRKIESIQEFCDCMLSYQTLIVKRQCIWKGYFLKNTRLTFVVVSYE